MNDSANRLNGAGRHFPLLYPDAGVVDQRYYALRGPAGPSSRPFWDGTTINLPPVFAWGSRIGAAPPNQRYPGWLNINRTQDVAISLTKVAGRHTIKARLLQQPQLQGAEHRRRRRGEPRLPGLRQLRQRHEQRRSTPASATPTRRWACSRSTCRQSKFDRRQHDLQQHRVLRPGQLEGEQPADARLRHALHAPAAAVRPVPADVELLPGAVVAGAGAGALRRRAAATARSPARATRATRWIRAPARS